MLNFRSYSNGKAIPSLKLNQRLILLISYIIKQWLKLLMNVVNGAFCMFHHKPITLIKTLSVCLLGSSPEGDEVL